ncbi:MAG: CDP-alcohol phosphatidyltransferase family protein [Gemmatimonadetes bacterium]|nr:CDP-alcohol phosphatidyltransferase family protein [Gemmatimonadota bacterium]
MPLHDRSASPRRSSILREISRSVPNQLSAFRLLMVPVLWVVAAFRLPVVLGVGWALAAATDVLDGYLARRSGTTTRFGSGLDSLADHLLTLSGFAWLLLFRRAFFREQLVPLLVWGALGLTVLAVSWLRFRRFADLHLYSTKAAALLGSLFAISLLVLGTYRAPVFHVVIGVCFFAALEALAVLLTRSRVDEHVGSIFLRRPARG